MKTKKHLGNKLLARIYGCSPSAVRGWRAAGCDVLNPDEVLLYAIAAHRMPDSFAAIFNTRIWTAARRAEIAEALAS